MPTKKNNLTASRVQYLFAEIAKSLTSSLDINKIISAIMKQVDLFFHPNNWSLLRVDPETGELYFAISKGIDDNIVKHLRLKMGEGIAGRAAKTGKPVLVKDVNRNIHFTKKIDKASGFKTESVIAVPIVYHNRTLGVIELINTEKKSQFTNYDLTVLKIIADFSAIAIVNSQAYERINFLAKSDPLTGLYNRLYLDKLITTYNHPAKSKRKLDKSYILTVIVDINNFKQVNDLYGHLVGDTVICATAKLLQACCRNNDFAFRLGGDEFLLVFTNLEKHDLQTTIVRIEHQLNLFTKQIEPAPGFSFGIASGKKSELDKLIVEADKLMYQHKFHNKS